MSRREENRQFKVTIMPIDPPAGMEDWADWQTVCVPVPLPLLAYIPILLTPLRWQGRVNGTSDEKKLFSEIWEDLITRFVTADPCNESGDVMRLRQNPDDTCQLEFSNDGGLTWELAFDYGLCFPPFHQFVFQNQTNNLFQQWSQTTNNTEINQYAPTQTFTSSPDETEERIDARRLALCYATKLYVAAYCESIKRINHDATAAANIANLALGVAAALAAISAVATGGATLPLYLGLGAALGGLGINSYSALTDAVLNDQDARDAVACLMYTNLRDVEPTAENFAAAVDGTTLSGNAEIIRATLTVDISNEAGLENQFNAFINLLGDSLRPAELGLIDDCPCDPYTWEEITLPSTGENVDKWTIDPEGGEFVSGQYFQSTNHVFDEIFNYEFIVITRTVDSDCRLTSILIEGEWEPGIIDPDTGDISSDISWGGNEVYRTFMPDNPTLPIDVSGIEYNGGLVSIGFIAGIHQPTASGGHMRITRIRLRGKGTPPS